MMLKPDGKCILSLCLLMGATCTHSPHIGKSNSFGPWFSVVEGEDGQKRKWKEFTIKTVPNSKA
jgi:hypothetical protein